MSISRVQEIMAQNDRWTLKVLSFPVFHDAFAKAILASPLADPAFVIALHADSAPDFLVKFALMEEALDPNVFQTLVSEGMLLEQFWSLIISSEKAFFSSTATQLGLDNVRTLLSPRIPRSIN